MSILTQLMKGEITFSQAATQIEVWAKNVVAHSPVLTAATGALLKDVKQGASDVLGWAETAVGSVAAPEIAKVESILDGIVAQIPVVGGVLTPYVNDGYEKIANAAIAEVQAWLLKVKGELTAPPTRP